MRPAQPAVSTASERRRLGFTVVWTDRPDHRHAEDVRRPTVAFMWLVMLLALAACSASPRWYGYAGEDSWTTPPGIPLQLRVSKYGNDLAGTVTAVALPATASESPTGPAVAGTRLPVTLDGVACEVSVLGRTTDTVERSQSAAEEKRRPHQSAGTRDLQSLSIMIACGDQPVPGTDASWRGARSRHSLPWAALIFVIACAAGELARRRRLWIPIGIGATAFAGSIALSLVLFDGLFKVTYMILFAGLGLIGMVAMRGDTVAMRIAIIVGTIAGAVSATLIWPLWNGFGPIVALVFAVLAGAIGAIGVALKQG